MYFACDSVLLFLGRECPAWKMGEGFSGRMGAVAESLGEEWGRGGTSMGTTKGASSFRRDSILLAG